VPVHLLVTEHSLQGGVSPGLQLDNMIRQAELTDLRDQPLQGLVLGSSDWWSHADPSRGHPLLTQPATPGSLESGANIRSLLHIRRHLVLCVSGVGAGVNRCA